MSDKTIRILLVEHRSSDARRIREMLHDATRADPTVPAFDLTRVTKLSTGLKRLAKGDFDVVLLDPLLPDAQGLHSFTAVHAAVPTVPIVVLSDPEDTALAVEAVQEGAQDHLIKGQTSGDLLVRSMRYAIERKQAERLLHLQRDLCIALGGTSDLTAAMNQLLESAVQIEGIDCAGVYFVDKPTGELTLIAHRGLSPQFVERTSHYSPDAPQTRLIMAGASVHQPYPELLRQGKDKVRREEGLRALVIVPVKHEGQVIAALNLASHTHDEIPAIAREAIETIAARMGGVVARISAEKALKESEEQYRTLFDRVPVGLYRSTPVGEILDVNPALVRILGYPDKKALLATDAADLYVDVEERARFKDLVEREGTLHDFETQMRQHDGTVISARIRSRAVRDDEGQILYYEGAVEDVTEQKQAEEALQESRQKLRAIFDQTFEFMGVMTLDGTLTEVNQTALDFAGVEASDVVGKPFWETVWWTHSPELQEELRDAAGRAASGEFVRFEANHPAADGSLHDADFSLKPVRDEAGNVRFLIPEGRDITERVRAEKALRIQRDLGIALSSTSDLTEALNQVLAATLQMEEIDSGGVYLFNALTGQLDLAVHTGMSAEFIDSVSHYDTDAPNTQLVLAGEPVYAHSAEFPPSMQAPLQREGLRAVAVIPVKYEGDVIAALNLASHTHDEIPISTRHALEAIAAQIGGVIARLEVVQALQASEERYRIISEITSDVTYAARIEPDGTAVIEWATGASVRMTGFTLDELNARGGRPSLMHPDDMDLAIRHLQVHLTGQPDVAEYRIITKGGEERWLRDYGYPVWDEDQGRVVRIIGAVQDITEQRLAKEALEKAELEKEIILDSQLEHVVYHDTEHRILWVNKAGYESVGATREELIGSYCYKVWGERSQPCEDCPVREAMQTNQIQEVTKETPDGRHWYIRGYPVQDAEGNIVGGIEITQDITERVRSGREQARAEEALRESAERFRALVQNSSDITVLLGGDGTVRYASPALERILGYEPDSIVGESPLEYVHPEDLAAVQEQLSVTLEQPGVPIGAEFRLQHADGSWVYLETIGSNLLAHPGVQGIVVNARDITERRLAEEALRGSEETLRALINAPTESAILTDTEGTILAVNETAAQRLGKSMDELVGLGIYDYLPPDLAKHRKARAGEVVRSGMPIRFQDERAGMHFDNSMYPVFDADRNVTAIAIYARDVTEIRRAEQSLRESEENYRSVVDNANVGIVVIQEGKQVLFNPRQLEILGYSEEEYGQVDFATLIHPDDRELALDRIRMRLMGEDMPPEGLEMRLITKSGDIRRVEAISSAIRWEGRPAIQAFLADITDRKRAEEALQESEMRYRTLFESANDAIFIMQHDQMIDCNRAAEVMFGRSRGDILGGTPYQFSPPHQPDGGDSMEKALERIQAALAGAPQFFEWVHCRPDGSSFDVEVNLTRMNLEGEALILAIVRDITERKKAAEELQRREAHQALVLGSLPMAFYTAHPYGDYGGTWVSDQIDQIVGFTAEEFLEDTHLWAARLHPEDRERVLGAFEKLPDSETLATEYRWHAADGEYVWLLDHAVLTRDEDGEPREIVGTWLDITERKRTEEEREQLLMQIQEQAQQLQQVMDSVPQGVILLDGKARIVLANPLGQEHLAILADTPVGGTLTHLGDRPLPEILASPPQELWHDITTEGKDFQIIARPIETGPVLGGWVLVIRDVTQQREVERRVQQQERLAAVGQLAAGIAHDFNNIMAVITLYANMSLRMTGLPPKLYKRLKTIDEQARRASHLIQQIMDFSRRTVLERGPMDLLAFVKEQTRLLQRTLPESITVSLNYGKDEYTIRADPTRIQQVVMNLATNARDAMPEGGQLRISLDLVWVEQDETGPLPEMNAGQWVCIEMADTGAGIPEDVLPHIFDPFFTTKEPGKGTGLGLAQVYGIVKQHEGHIDVQTIEGEGTTFSIYLPALSVEHAETPPTEAKDLPRGQGRTILVVEDDATMREATVSSLELLGYQAIETANGREALEVLEQRASQIALVLSDLVMPEMGGQVLFRELARVHPGTKIILMSGHPMEEAVLEELRAEGLVGWLPKPPDLAELAEAIAQTLVEK